jgi:hypothetical protein
MNTRGFHPDQRWLEQHLWTTEPEICGCSILM